MNKKRKKLYIIIGIVVAICLLIFIGIMMIGKSVNSALSKQVNAEIDMNRVEDGTYIGEGDGGIVKVKVEAEVKDHKIINIKILKHDNGMGEKAETMIDEMIESNTDNVDGVSGATVSSKTIRNAVNKALQQGIK